MTTFNDKKINHKNRWPAEWEEHVATWMAFPCRQSIWRNGVDKAQQAFAMVANQISEYEPVNMLLLPEHKLLAKKLLSSQINLIEAAIDDSWCRDTTPVWIESDDQSIALNFEFNAWGNKFTPYENDKNLARFVAQTSNSLHREVNLILEGGSIHGNGKDTLLTTKECLLNSNRNPQLSQTEIEAILATELGIQQFIWLDKGVYGDVDTDGHIDNIACFVNQTTILTQTCGEQSENFNIYRDNKNIIQDSGMSLVELEEPEPLYYDGERVPLSYINFYIANGAIIAPKFACKQDQQAKSILQELFSNRKVHMIDANEILVGGGGIHCITMQQPKIVF